MADNRNNPTPAPKPPDNAPVKGDANVSAHDHWRRQAALAILSGYVSKQGGFGFDAAEREILMRMVWSYADTFVSMEHAPAPTIDAVPLLANRPARKTRPVAPNDEWGVRDGDTTKKGFVSREEAEWYASARPGAEVFQLSGPGTLIAPATA